MATETPPAPEVAGEAANHRARAGKAKKKTDRPRGRKSALEQVAAALAGGDLAAHRILSHDAQNAGAGEQRALAELTALGRSLRHAVGRLQRAVGSIDLISTRALEGGHRLAHGVGDEAASVDATVSLIAEISASARTVAQGVGSLAHLVRVTSASSLEMAASIDEVFANADALTAFVEETAASIEKMAASVRNVAASTRLLAEATEETAVSMRAIDDSTQRVGLAVSETAVLAEEVKRSAEQGSSIVLETTQSMRATRWGIEEASKTIAVLGERSERIGAITRVIDGIAERTNLLALNARILAAQQPAQGRGFAVVAEEIKELSERTARSTEAIDELIKDVRDGVAAAGAQTSSNRQLADASVRLAESAADSLDEISRKTGLSAAAIRQIAEAAAVQSLESHQVAELSARVRQRAQEIERATSEQAHTAQRIGERALQMAGLTEQVRRAMQEQAATSKHIAEAMEQLTDVVGHIGSSVEQQHRSMEDVLGAIEAIRASVARNQASIMQITHVTGLLDNAAASLRDWVSQYQLPAPRRGGHLRYGVPAGATAPLDVRKSSTPAISDLRQMVCEGLVGAGEGAEIKPFLAESWEASADGRTYTFHLRAGVRFHNGRTMCADDVVYSIGRALRLPTSGGWVFRYLLGAEEFARGDAEQLAGARALNDLTVELQLTEPIACFLPMLCSSSAAIVPREEIEGVTGVRFDRRPIGTGPFRFISCDTEAGWVELARFDNYWERDKPYVDGVTIRYDENGEELFESLQRGELTVLREESGERVERLANDPEWRSCIVLANQLHTQFLIFDAEQPPFDDARVRRAVAHAIDKRRLIEEAYGPLAVTAAGPIPPGLVGYDPEYRGLQYDPELARRLLREAGYASGLKLTLWRSFAEVSAGRGAGDIICEQLGKIGITCEIQAVDKGDLIKATRDGRAQLAELNWYADYADPDDFTYVLFHSSNRGSGIGRTARVAEVDRLSAQARATINYAERARLYRLLQQIIAEEALCAFLTHHRVAIIHHPNVEGLYAHLVSPIVRPQEIWLASDE